MLRGVLCRWAEGDTPLHPRVTDGVPPPQCHPAPPSCSGTIPVSAAFCDLGALPAPCPGSPGAAEPLLVCPQRGGPGAMATEMVLSHRPGVPRGEVLSEAELEELAQRKPPSKTSVRGCLRKAR